MNLYNYTLTFPELEEDPYDFEETLWALPGRKSRQGFPDILRGSVTIRGCLQAKSKKKALNAAQTIAEDWARDTKTKVTVSSVKLSGD